MATPKNRTGFATSQEGIDALAALLAMVESGNYHTDASYSANTTAYSDNSIPFVDKHMQYLQSHPAIDVEQYIANLRLMTRARHHGTKKPLVEN